jgi:hypothetical protein
MVFTEKPGHRQYWGGIKEMHSEDVSSGMLRCAVLVEIDTRVRGACCLHHQGDHP